MPTGNKRSGAFHRNRHKRRKELFAVRQDCHWCGVPLDITAPSDAWNYPTLDHIVPRSEGGTGAISNLTLACARCNSSRHHLSAGSRGDAK